MSLKGVLRAADSTLTSAFPIPFFDCPQCMDGKGGQLSYQHSSPLPEFDLFAGTSFVQREISIGSGSLKSDEDLHRLKSPMLTGPDR